MIVHEKFSLTNRYGDPIYGDLRYPQGAQSCPIIVFSHGVKGFKDWGFWPVMGKHLARIGIASIAFNYSLNGFGTDGLAEFARPDLFEQNTFSREVDDLDDVFRAIQSGILAQGVADPTRIGLIGHSRGGGIAIIRTSEDHAVKALTTWNAVGDFYRRFTPQMIADWETKGYTEIRNDRTGEILHMGRGLYDDAMAHQDRLNISACASRIMCPWLIAHAEDDNVVPMLNADLLASSATILVERFTGSGQHTFGAAHPMPDPFPDALMALLERTTTFFQTHLFPA